jgi:hypothetical protein
MFVRQSTYNAKCRAFDSLARLYVAEVDECAALRKRWNALVARINKLGGEAFLNAPKPAQFTKEEIQKLILLCHPDKHDGKPMANEMTAKLLTMKGGA